MAIKPSKFPPPSVSRLVKVLKWSRYSDARLRELEAREQKADNALQHFLQTNKEHKRLQAARDKAGQEEWAYRQVMQKEFNIQKNALINAVMIDGPTPEIVKKIKTFCDRFNGGGTLY